MSSILLIGTMLAVFVIALFNPFIGVLTYVWISVAVPQASVWGSTVAGLPYAVIAGIIGALSIFAGRKNFQWNSSPVIAIILLFLIWTTLTTTTSINPDLSWAAWNQNWKVFLSAVLIACVCTTRQRLYLLLVVVVGSVGIIAFKGALQFILSGGSSLIVGPQGGQAGENNGIARYFGIVLPLAAVMMFHSRQRWLRWAFAAVTMSCLLALIGTDSRGAFVALGVAGAYLFLFSRNKAKLALVAVLAAGLVSLLSSDAALDSWMNRMETVKTAQEDISFMGRVEAWGYAWELAKAKPITGGGFMSFQSDITGDRKVLRDFHNIYFEALGDHGFPGLMIYAALLLTVFSRAVKLYRHCRTEPRLYFERDLGFACQLSMVFFLVAGITGSETYNDIVFILFAIVAAADRLVFQADRLSGRQGGAIGMPAGDTPAWQSRIRG